MTCTGAQPNGFVAATGVNALTVTIQAGATIGPQQTGAGANPSFADVRVNGASTVNNAGTIANAAPLNRDNFGVNLAGDLSTLNNTGLITLTAPAGNATTRIYGAYSSAPDGQQYASTTINNSGAISLTQNGNGRAQGVYAGENTTLFTLTNSGSIQAARGTSATASTNVVAGVDSDDDTDRFVLNNTAGGGIAASGTNARAVNGRAAQLEITNAGTIAVTPGATPTGFEAAIATYTGTAAKTYNTVITNAATGVITGDVRNTDVDQQTAASAVTNRRSGTLTNAGTINGNLAFGTGNQTITNTGRISGNLSFLDAAAAGAAAGTVNTVNLGTGSSIGGSITARGLGTNTLNLTGTGTLTGTVSGFTSLNQNTAGSAWTTGNGSTQAISGNLTVAGGNLTLGAGSTQTVGGLVQVTGSGAQLTVANTLAKTVNLSGSNTTLVNNGTVRQTGADGSANTTANRVYGVLANSTGADFTNVNVVNTGTISVAQGGLALARGIYAGENIASMFVTNSGTISATRTAASAGTTAVAAIDSDDDVAALTVTNQAGGTISGAGTGARAVQGRAQTYTITNAGTITGPTGGQAVVVYGNGNGLLTNTATGTINGDVRFTDADPQNATTTARRNSTTTNAGTINGSILYGMGNHTLTNTGRITGGVTLNDVAGSVNTVNLGTGSSVGGAITGQGLGTNTLNLTGTGTLTGTLSGFTSLNQTGTGSAWTTGSGSVQTISGNLTVAGGNLTLGAGSTQTVGGVIQVTGSGAQLTVANTQTNKTVNLSGSNTTLVNNGTLTGTGAAGRANTAATRVYGVLANSTGADFANVNVVNTGTIAVTENGIGISRGIYAGENIASMAITNAGTISATRSAASTGTAAVAGIDSDDDVAALTVTNQAGGTISGAGTGVRAIQGRAQAFTIANAGTITGPAGGQAIVVYGNGTGVLSNTATGTINGDVRFTDADPQVATSTARRNSTTTNAGRINGGVLYGMGNHTLTNTGTVTGAITFNDVAASVNTVNLGTGSTIGGAITAQGRGANAIALSGTGTLASNVAGFTTLSEASGTYTLASGTTQSFSGGASVTGGILTVNSRLNADTAVGPAGTLSGTGTIGGNLTNNGLVQAGTAAAPYGTLSVTGTYAQGAGGTLAAAIDPTGQASRVAAGGRATLAGTASLITGSGTYVPGTRYTLVTAAGGVTGGFSAVTTPNALPTLIRATASTDATNAYVTLTQQSFALVATTQNQASAARGLDAVLAGNTAALTALDNQSDRAVAGILDRVAGQGYASLADPQLRSGRAFTDQLVQRAYTAVFEPGATGFTLPPAVYAADMPNRAPVPEPRFIAASRGYGIWATGYGQFGSVNGTANAAGRQETIAGFAGGVDVHTQPGTVLGVAAGYGSVDVGLSRTGERAHTDNAQVGVYGGITSGPLYGTLALGYAHAEGTLNRSLGAIALQPNGSRGSIGGDQFLSAGEAGYRVTYAPGQVLTPFVGFQVSTFDQDRVAERSGGPFDLTVAARDFLSARTLVGGRLDSSIVVGGRSLSVAVKAAYVHDFADVSRTIQSSFALAPTVPFLVGGRRLDRDRTLVGVGIASALAPGWVGFVNYDAELAGSDTLQAVRGGARYTF